MAAPAARRIISGSLAVVIAGAVLVTFGPRSLGGPVSYVVIARGASMEPNIHVGDLALAKRAHAYKAGDAVAYFSRDYGRVVLHRIIRVEGDHYFLKGDNNNFVDAYHPTNADVIGKMWLRIPSGGRVVSFVRTPRNVALIAAVLAMLFMGTAAKKRRANTPRANTPRANTPRANTPRANTPRANTPRANTPMRAPMGIRADHATVCAAAFVAFGLLAAASITHSTTTSASLDYRHSGTLRYRASVPVSGVYPTRTAPTGQPIFLRLSRKVRVDFSYHLLGLKGARIAGRWALRAEVHATNGWKRSIRMTPASAFIGDFFNASGTLDVRSLHALVEHMRELTGVIDASYQVTIVPDVHVDGSIQGRPIHDEFSPRYLFQLDDLQLQAVSDPSAPAQMQPFAATQAGSVVVPGGPASPLRILKVAVPIPLARGVGLIGALLTLIALALAWRARRSLDTESESGRIARRYRDVLVPIASAPEVRAIEVCDVEALGNLAERYDTAILHVAAADGDSYFVEHGASVFRFDVPRAEIDVLVPTPLFVEAPDHRLDEQVAWGS